MLVLLGFLAACFVGGALTERRAPGVRAWWVALLCLCVCFAYYILQAL